MEDEEAVAFRKRIESAVATVQAWDADPDLLAECRAQIPLDRLRRDENNATDAAGSALAHNNSTGVVPRTPPCRPRTVSCSAWRATFRTK